MEEELASIAQKKQKWALSQKAAKCFSMSMIKQKYKNSRKIEMQKLRD